MVIGNGLLANRFTEYKLNRDVVIFASGVSDSKEVDNEAFEREFSLLAQTIKTFSEKLIVYFSTCSVYDHSLEQTPYVKHKLLLENLIKKTQKQFIIFRISNIVGSGGNPKTIVNYLVNVIQNAKHFHLWKNAYRNVIDLDDAYLLMDFFIKKFNASSIVNIANPTSYNIMEMINAIERFTGKKGNYTIIEKGEQFFIDTTQLIEPIRQLNISFSSEYFSSILKKYYHFDEL